MEDAVFYDDQEGTENYTWDDWSEEEKKTLRTLMKMYEYRIFRNKFPTWEGKGFKVRGNNKKTQYAYGNDINDSHSKGWKEIFINPPERQISMFVAKVNKNLWNNIPFKYQWYDKRPIIDNKIKARDTNIYNMKVETATHYAFYWIYDKFVIKNSKRHDNCQIIRHNEIISQLEYILRDYEPEMIDTGYVPNPWFYYGTVVEKSKCCAKSVIKFENILSTDEYKIANEKAMKKANKTKIEITKNKLFSVKTERPLSVRKLANLAKVSKNTVQKYRKELESKNLLKITKRTKEYINQS